MPQRSPWSLCVRTVAAPQLGHVGAREKQPHLLFWIWLTGPSKQPASRGGTQFDLFSFKTRPASPPLPACLMVGCLLDQPWHILQSPACFSGVGWVGYTGFPDGTVVKKAPASVGDKGSRSPVGKIPWRGAWQPAPVFLPGGSHQRSPWGRRVGHD